MGLTGYTSTRCFVVADEHEAKDLPEFDRVCVVSQTTQNDDTSCAHRRCHQTQAKVIRATNTVCEPTRDHQSETIDLAHQVDLMVVVGGHHSANTCRLADLAAEEGSQVLHIETDAELQDHDFTPYGAVGVTAGASTPEWMINRVVDKLESFNEEPVSQLNTWLKHLVGVCCQQPVCGFSAAST